MGGKGRKRREKNYRAAHGGHSRLPPPPVASSVEALPSKLRQIINFSRSPQPGSAEVSGDSAQKNKGNSGGSGDRVEKVRCPSSPFVKLKKLCSEEKIDFNNSGVKRKGYDEIEEDSMHEKKKKKRKRKTVDDLRFEAGELSGVGSKRKERKKKRLQEMKKKHKKGKADEDLDFPGREEIRFGDVVKAPPKLVTVPKGKKLAQEVLGVMKGTKSAQVAFGVAKEKKSVQDASKERLRLEAVDAYRNRRGWTSRPGIHLPQPELPSQSL